MELPRSTSIVPILIASSVLTGQAHRSVRLRDGLPQEPQVARQGDPDAAGERRRGAEEGPRWPAARIQNQQLVGASLEFVTNRRGSHLASIVATRRETISWGDMPWVETHGYHQTSLREGDTTLHEMWTLFFGRSLTSTGTAIPSEGLKAKGRFCVPAIDQKLDGPFCSRPFCSQDTTKPTRIRLVGFVLIALRGITWLTDDHWNPLNAGRF